MNFNENIFYSLIQDNRCFHHLLYGKYYYVFSTIIFSPNYDLSTPSSSNSHFAMSVYYLTKNNSLTLRHQIYIIFNNSMCIDLHMCLCYYLYTYIITPFNRHQPTRFLINIHILIATANQIKTIGFHWYKWIVGHGINSILISWIIYSWNLWTYNYYDILYWINIGTTCLPAIKS